MYTANHINGKCNWIKVLANCSLRKSRILKTRFIQQLHEQPPIHHHQAAKRVLPTVGSSHKLQGLITSVHGMIKHESSKLSRVFIWRFVNHRQVNQMTHGRPSMGAVPGRLESCQMFKYLHQRWVGQQTNYIAVVLSSTVSQQKSQVRPRRKLAAQRKRICARLLH